MYNSRAMDSTRVYNVSVSFTDEEFRKLKLIRADFGEPTLQGAIRRLVDLYEVRTKTLTEVRR